MGYAPHHRHYVAELPPKGKPMKEAKFNSTSLAGYAPHPSAVADTFPPRGRLFCNFQNEIFC